MTEVNYEHIAEEASYHNLKDKLERGSEHGWELVTATFKDKTAQEDAEWMLFWKRLNKKALEKLMKDID